MPRLSIQIKGVKIVRKGLENLKKKIPDVARQRLWNLAVGIRKEMKVKGAKPTYPIPWDSDRQRKAFFASNGFGRGIPTKRTGEYTKAWKAIKVQEGHYEVSNPLAHAKYIAGNSGSSEPQSKIHQGRWNRFFFVIQRALRTLPKEIRVKVDQVIRDEGFRAK